MQASRTKKSIHNSTVALGYFLVSLFINFFSRKVFLDYLGTDILGLNTTAQNLLQFLNLTELGIGSAIGFSLYKPLQQGDENTINEIVTLQGKLYKRIGLIIALCGLVLMAFFPLIFKKMTLPLWYAYAAFAVFLFGSVLGYFVNYKQILLSSSQQDYKIQYSYRTIQLIKVVCQIIAVYWLPFGYMWWLGLEVVCSSIASWSLHRTTIKEFPTLKNVKLTFKQLRIKYHSIVVKVKQLFFHKIGGFALTQTSPVIIYAYINLNEVALYGNYMLIITGINQLINAVFNSVNAGIGNLVAEGDETKIRKVFEELLSIRFFISATLAAAVLFFSQPFIVVWIGEEYLLSFSTLILLTSMLFMLMVRVITDSYINAYGLYGDIWSPIIEASLNIGLSVLLGKFFGLNGIIGGVCISLLIIVMMWKPYYLFTRAIKGYLGRYVLSFTTNLAISIGTGFGVWYLCNSLIDGAANGFVQLVINGAIVIGFYAICLIIFLAIFTPGMRYALRRFRILR